jgi:hypothetical protein
MSETRWRYPKMRFKKLAWLTITSMAMLALTACNIGATPAPTLDANAIYTSAAETYVADFSVQQTQTALSIPPTATPTYTLAPTFSAALTPIPGVGTPAATSGLPILPTSANVGGPQCNNAVYVADVTIPDGTILKPGADFKKTWSIQNSGTCAWTEGYVFAFASGDEMDGYDLPIAKNQSVAPGQIVEMTINMTAHIAEGTYIGYWRMKDPQGNFFGSTLYYKIKVEK